MTSERIEGPTPHGDWALVVWMDLDRWVEVERDDPACNGCVITEYKDGVQVMETVARLESTETDP